MKFSRKLKYWIKRKKYTAPEGYYRNAYEFINNYPENKLIQLIAPETVSFNEPKFYKEEDTLKIIPIDEVTYPEDFVLILKNGRVWGEEGIVITPDNKLIADKISYADMENHRAYYNYKIPKTQYIKGNVAIIASVWATGYYHWFIDIIPRLHLLNKSEIKIDKYIINSLERDFQLKFLNLFDIDKEKLIFINDKTHIHAENLIVPSLNGTCGNPAPWIFRFYKEKFNIQPDAKFPEKIYISRENVAQRKIVNENELISMLSKKGFVKIKPEDYSIIDQFKIFASAKTIISAHGAALSNIIFSHQNTKLIEIYHPDYMNLIYYKMSQINKLDYHYFIAQNAGDKQEQNMYVDLDVLEKAL